MLSMLSESERSSVPIQDATKSEGSKLDESKLDELDSLVKQSQDKIVLFAGCGGGYDLFGALPLMFRMQRAGVKEVVLTNFSFTDPQSLERLVELDLAKKWNPFMYEVKGYPQHDGGDDLVSKTFCPEARLAQELKQSVFAILIHENPTLTQLEECYQLILKHWHVEMLFLCDGGCDVLLTGAEEELGTPTEDMMHLFVMAGLVAPKVDQPLGQPISKEGKDQKGQIKKYVIAVGVDVDMGHRVKDEDLTQRLEDLTQDLIFAWQYDVKHDDVSRYVDIVSSCQPVNSTVQSLVIAAAEGHTGFYTPPHLKARIGQNRVSLSKRVATLYCYPLDVIAKGCLYLHLLEGKQDTEQVDDLIGDFHSKLRGTDPKEWISCG